jgi:hypothetical protein
MNIISLDIETFGAVKYTLSGKAMPEQRYFNAHRNLKEVDRNQLIQTIGITYCQADSLVDMVPVSSMCLSAGNPKDMEVARAWIAWADVIVGHNILFDLSHLVAVFRDLPFDDQLLVENMALSYLVNENRESRSLKDIAKVLAIHEYEYTLKHDRFMNKRDPILVRYQCEDTHVTMLEAAHFAAELDKEGRLNPYQLELYSGLLWASLRMQNSAYCMDRGRLETQQVSWERRLRYLAHILDKDYGLVVKGKGSINSKYEKMDSLIDDVDEEKVRRYFNTDDVMLLADFDKPEKGLLALTKKTKQVSASVQNRKLLRHLVKSPINVELIDLWNEYATISKLVSSYATPLLGEGKSSLIEIEGKHFACPSIYVVPSSYAGDDEGGQIQGRISFQAPATQTFPRVIKEFKASRYPDGVLVSRDASQLEPRTAAVLSGEPVLLEDFRNGGDVHTTQAILVYGEEELNRRYAHIDEAIRLTKRNEEFNEHERQIGKGTGLAALYRSSGRTQQAQALRKDGIIIPIAILNKAVRELPRIKPVLYAWQEQMIKEAHDNRRIVLAITGQQRLFLGGSSHMVTEMVNFPVQCHGANTISRLLYYLHRRLPALSDPDPPIHLYQCTHDSVAFDCKDPDHAARVDHLIDEAVEWLSSEDYWHLLTSFYGNPCPLVFEKE